MRGLRGWECGCGCDWICGKGDGGSHVDREYAEVNGMAGAGDGLRAGVRGNWEPCGVNGRRAGVLVLLVT